MPDTSLAWSSDGGAGWQPLRARDRAGGGEPDDGGAEWQRINDNAHQWGLRLRMISGDPRLFGRVYVATDGRGILYGDPKEGVK